MARHDLRGCRPEPLGAYLKALGVLRLVGTQADSSATGHWEGDDFVLETALDADELVAFFLDEYYPTPLVAPWNGGSGFGTKDQQLGIDAIERSTSGRLGMYRDVIRQSRMLVAAPGWKDLAKEQQVERCRGSLPDDALGWIDATVVLTADSRAFPPLLGTGGNVGRLEFSNNFMQRLVQVLCLDSAKPQKARVDSESWLKRSLWEVGSPKLVGAAVGQFDPGAAGGANTSPIGDAGSLVNPWDYVLLLEGAISFASGMSRRLGSEQGGRASIPFTVDAAPVGFPTTAESENSRGELWAPLWRQPASARELARVVEEGRAEWRGRQARTGLDFARAVSTLAVDRGISAFVRHAFVERHGQNMLAVPVGRFRVVERRESAVLATLDPWLDRIRAARNMPNGVATDLRSVDAAMFEVARRGGPDALQRALTAVADLEQAVARSGQMRDQARFPIQRLSASTWLPLLDDGSPELRLAAAVASQHDPIAGANDAGHRSSTVAHALRPVQGTHGRRLEWRDGGAAVPGIGARPLVAVLSALLQQRAVDAPHDAPSPDAAGPEEGQRGIHVAWARRCSAPLEDVARFLVASTDDHRLEGLIAASSLLDWSRLPDVSAWLSVESAGGEPLATAWAILAPFFQPTSAGEPSLRPAASWAPLLVAGRTADVLDDAVRRLRIARLEPAVASRSVMADVVDPGRLGAALAFPLSRFAAKELLNRVCIRSTIPSEL